MIATKLAGMTQTFAIKIATKSNFLIAMMANLEMLKDLTEKLNQRDEAQKSRRNLSAPYSMRHQLDLCLQITAPSC